MQIGRLKIYDIDYKINFIFIPINFILKRFNYIISFSFQYWFDKKNLTSNIYSGKLSIKKLENNKEIYRKILKEYIIYKKTYGLSNCKEQ
jgi:hypothetical protein